MAITVLIWMLFPGVVLTILVVKSGRVWCQWLRSMPRWKQVCLVIFLLSAISFGGSKPGPTRENLRLLLATRAKLSNGQSYGSKATIINAASISDQAAVSGSNSVVTVSNSVTHLNSISNNVSDVSLSTRQYIRLVAPSPVVTNRTLHAELLRITATNGIAEAAVWFNVVPTSDPKMRFHFTSETATNLWYTAIPTTSTFPDTFTVNTRQCYLFYYSVPDALLNANGCLLAPLQYEKRIQWGCPETSEPLDLRGGIAIQKSGEYYIGVTGFRTNVVDGSIYYFDNGRLATPPAPQD